MHEAYRDDFASVLDDEPNRLIPRSVRRATSALVFLALVTGMAVWAYRLGTQDARDIPVVRAIEGPARVLPEDAGGYTAENQGHTVNEVMAGSPAPAPVPRAMPGTAPDETVNALSDEDGAQGEIEIAGRLTLSQEARVGSEGTLAAETAETDAGPAADTPGGVDVAALVQSAAEDLSAGPDAGGPAGLRPMRRPQGFVPAAAVATGRQVAKPVASTAAPVEPREVTGLPAGTRMVQLGAFDSEDITRKAWAQLVANNSDLLGEKSLYIERTTSNARVFYRLRVVGFGNTDETRQMCEALRGRGIDCIPVTLQ